MSEPTGRPSIEWLPPHAPGGGEPPRITDGPPAEPFGPPQNPARGRRALPQVAATPMTPAPPPSPMQQPPVPLAKLGPGYSSPRPVGGPSLQKQAPPAGAKGRNRQAVLSLSLGITGLAMTVLTLGMAFVFSIPVSYGAFHLGRKARREIEEAGPGAPGRTEAQFGYWLGVVGLVVGGTAAAVWLILSAAGFDAEKFLEDLRRELDESRGSSR